VRGDRKRSRKERGEGKYTAKERERGSIGIQMSGRLGDYLKFKLHL
jgi:hypothetical protein